VQVARGVERPFRRHQQNETVRFDAGGGQVLHVLIGDLQRQIHRNRVAGLPRRRGNLHGARPVAIVGVATYREIQRRGRSPTQGQRRCRNQN
jgi:hypothetical protein